MGFQTDTPAQARRLSGNSPNSLMTEPEDCYMGHQPFLLAHTFRTLTLTMGLIWQTLNFARPELTSMNYDSTFFSGVHQQ